MWLDAWGYGKVVLPTLELPRRDNPMTHNAEIARAKNSVRVRVVAAQGL